MDLCAKYAPTGQEGKWMQGLQDIAGGEIRLGIEGSAQIASVCDNMACWRESLSAQSLLLKCAKALLRLTHEGEWRLVDEMLSVLLSGKIDSHGLWEMWRTQKDFFRLATFKSDEHVMKAAFMSEFL